MTLNKLMLVLIAAMTLVGASAQARTRDAGDAAHRLGWPFPGRPGGPGHGPFPPGYPPPPPPGPGNGRQESRSVFIGQRIIDNDLFLRQLARIGDDYRGYSVDSVVVEVRSLDPRTQVILFTDGRAGDMGYNPQGRIILRPRFGDVIGRDFVNLVLSVRGVADIGNITINLVDRGGYNPGPGPGPGPGYPSETINVNISRRLYGVDRLELAPFIDMYRYRGYRIESVDVEAAAAYNNSLLDLAINGYNQGQTETVDRYRRLVGFRPYNATIGYGNDSITLNTRGDVDIYRVIIRLSR